MDVALQGKFKCIFGQIDENLLQADLVAVEAFGQKAAQMCSILELVLVVVVAQRRNQALAHLLCKLI